VFTGRCVEARDVDGRPVLDAAAVFEHAPIALLEAI
jgi:hypothetical protein